MLYRKVSSLSPLTLLATVMATILVTVVATAPAIVSANEDVPTGTAMLPVSGERDANIPQPVDVFGFEVGEQHVRHDQLVAYFRELAASSDRMKLESIGRTHEGREQVLAIISSSENIRNIEQIREQHLAVSRGEAAARESKVVVWQGYSIHGDESSGSNAVPLYAWHLASTQDPAVLDMLDDVVVLIDPSLNPDGMGRFAAWATSRRGQVPVSDANHDEHIQQWPRGRGNHYWFDLNRDWLLLQHPESRNRVGVLNRWRPHVVTDHHEMGRNSTFFFQPGVPERTNPQTPEKNQELTGMIAEFHAKLLDREGRLYYSKESFDDFYYGKGSTYPDINGGIGILFEQASTRGQAIDTPFGVRTFARSVQNQLITSLSTLEAAHALRDNLRDYQAKFFSDARTSAGGAFVVDAAGNTARMNAFLELLAGHDIRFAPLQERVIRNGHEYQPGEAWVIPVAQEKSRLIEIMFEMRTTFPSNIFYDVSAWTLPLAFDLEFSRLGGVPDIGELQQQAPLLQKRFSPELDAVAYAFDWKSDNAPRVLQQLLAADIKVMAATKPLTLKTANATASLDRGSIFVPIGVQSSRRGDILRILSEAASASGLDVHAVTSGLALDGVDLGSPSLEPLDPIKPLLVIGDGMNPYEAGEIWHMADTRLGLPLTQVTRDALKRIDLHEYTHVILVGTWGGLGDSLADRLHDWMSSGGVLIAQQSSADWAGDNYLHLSQGERKQALKDDKKDDDADDEKMQRRDYADFDTDYAKRLISGTIFMTDVDTSHPLGFGLADRELPVFKDRADILEPSENPYQTVAKFTDSPLLAGYVSSERLNEVVGSAAVIADRVGGGVLVRFAIDPVFRGYWYGTQRLLVNALYFSQAIDYTNID